MNTDLSYASKEDFQTDAQIAAAKQNGELGLVPNIFEYILYSPNAHPLIAGSHEAARGMGP